MGRIRLLRFFRRPDQHEVQQHMPLVDEPEVQQSLKPASSVERNTRAIPQDVKIEVAVRDGGRCRQCGSNKELHFDHVIPWSKGGPNTVDNIQLLCGTCNRRKGADDIPADLPPSPYRQPWRSPAADSRPSQPPGTYKSPPPLSYMSEQETEPTCPACGMLSALHTGAPCPATGESIKAPPDP
jgi:5-methylcytosine-specific restriction endonuclease McrA